MAEPVVGVLGAIGNTPVVELTKVVPEGSARIFLKLESLNPTGSYKDRMAKSIIEEAERRGDLKPGVTVVEATGGSTGSSLALFCAVKGYKFHVACSNAFAAEKLRTMAAFGADLHLINSPTGEITAELFGSIVAYAKSFTGKPGYYLADQFNNRDAFVGYAQLGEELIKQFPDGIDAFCAAIGGAGMCIGASKVIKPRWPQCRVIVLEPASAPLLTQGKTGKHSVEGVGPGFIPPLLDKEFYDEARAIEEAEAREMCKRLAREEGLLVGTSTGLNVTAAVALAKELGPGKTVVTVACDTGLKYMSGNLFIS